MAAPIRRSAGDGARFARDVSERVRRALEARLADFLARGRSLSDLGEPSQLAERMLSLVPEPSPWDEHLGPFYSTRAVSRLLGGVTRQAVAERRDRRRLLGLRTADGEWVYPAFQFGPEGTSLPGLAAVLARFPADEVDDWLVAAWLVARQPGLGGRSVAEWLGENHDLTPVLALAADTAERLAG